MIVPDTSVLIAFEKSGILHLLGKLPVKVAVTPAVLAELLAKSPDSAGCEAFVSSASSVAPPQAEPVFKRRLGAGEREVIALALETNSVPVLDDIKALKEAKELGLVPVQTIDLLTLCEEWGLIESAAALIMRLAAVGVHPPASS